MASRGPGVASSHTAQKTCNLSYSGPVATFIGRNPRVWSSAALPNAKDKATAFLELLLPLRKQLEVYCRRMLRNPSDVEDVLQTAVARAFAQFDRYREGTNFKAWVFRHVTLEIFNRNRQPSPAALGEAPADQLAEECWEQVEGDVFAAMLDDPDVLLEYFDDAVIAALENLAPLERAVLLLRAIGEFSYKEMHELLAVPLGSVIGYLSRARKRMRMALAEYAESRGTFRRGSSPEGHAP
jgi:RNA polymerase sigma-70 factor, ECF subfamily